MSYASPSDGMFAHVDYSASRPPPFIAWLHQHGLLKPTVAWECKYQPAPFDGHEGPVFRRKGAAPLIIRPKRHTYV